MKLTLERITRWIRALFEGLERKDRRAGDVEAPLRAELFSADQMEDHGAVLASWPS